MAAALDARELVGAMGGDHGGAGGQGDRDRVDQLGARQVACGAGDVKRRDQDIPAAPRRCKVVAQRRGHAALEVVCGDDDTQATERERRRPGRSARRLHTDGGERLDRRRGAAGARVAGVVVRDPGDCDAGGVELGERVWRLQ